MSIKAHGGAVQYWIHVTGLRCCLCEDGTVLRLRGGRWQESDRPLSDFNLSGWKTDTRSSISAAITRTGREARREE